MRTPYLTSGLTFWMPAGLRSLIDEEATNRSVSMGEVARDYLQAGLVHLKPRHLRTRGGPAEAQISFMIPMAWRRSLWMLADEHKLTLSEIARTVMAAGQDWRSRPQ